MSEEDGERKLVDAAGEFRYVARDGQPTPDAGWQSCRLVLTTERLVLGTDDGTKAVPHGKLRVLEADAVPGDATVGDAMPLRIGDAALLLDSPDVEDLELALHRAVAADRILPVRHPAVVGGVVQEDATWRKARLRPGGDAVAVAFPDGERTAVALADVESVERLRESVGGEERPVVAVAHADAEGRTVETHVAGSERAVDALVAVFEDAVDARETDYELSEDERQVLLALYSGVSPFEMADFVGLEVDEVEAIYQRLLEAGAVDEVRTRTEVTLNATGRNMASEAMSEE